jgi:hypothetical protein
MRLRRKMMSLNLSKEMEKGWIINLLLKIKSNRLRSLKNNNKKRRSITLGKINSKMESGHKLTSLYLWGRVKKLANLEDLKNEF